MLAQIDAPNVRTVVGPAEDVDASWGRFDLVTAGRSFHWFDAERDVRAAAARTPTSSRCSATRSRRATRSRACSRSRRSCSARSRRSGRAGATASCSPSSPFSDVEEIDVDRRADVDGGLADRPRVLDVGRVTRTARREAGRVRAARARDVRRRGVPRPRQRECGARPPQRRATRAVSAATGSSLRSASSTSPSNWITMPPLGDEVVGRGCEQSAVVVEPVAGREDGLRRLVVVARRVPGERYGRFATIRSRSCGIPSSRSPCTRCTCAPSRSAFARREQQARWRTCRSPTPRRSARAMRA